MAIRTAQPPLLASTELTTTNILGPSYFELCELEVAGSAGQPMPPTFTVPQSPYIVAADEDFTVHVKLKFNSTPLTRLLLCLGMNMEVNFAFEGIGGQAKETDVSVVQKTVKDVFEYEISWTGTPTDLGLDKGLYAIAAVVSISPADHPCSQEVIGYGYIAAQLLQVYPA